MNTLSRKWIRAACAIAFAGALFFSSSGAADATAALSASIEIKAVVRAWAEATVLQAPASIVVTAEDVRKGYIDPAPALLRIGTNDPRGCLLTIYIADYTGQSPLQKVQVTIMGRTLPLGVQGGLIHLAALGRNTVPVTYRLLLKQDARPGVYAWPFLISAETI